MPESKSKRKKKGRRQRPPAVQTPPKRKRTARWVPWVFFSTMGAGIVLIITNYMGFWEFRNAFLFIGLGLMAIAFAVSTRWY